jgi:hypothetical protein
MKRVLCFLPIFKNIWSESYDTACPYTAIYWIEFNPQPNNLHLPEIGCINCLAIWA